MKAAVIQLGTLLALTCWALGQNTSDVAILQSCRVLRDGGRISLELNLSAPVKASISSKSHQLILDLPHTMPNVFRPVMEVNQFGVESVRVELLSAIPPATRIIVELKQAQPYDLESSGNKITLALSAAPPDHGGAPAAGSSGSIGSIFHRHKKSQPIVADQSNPEPVPGSPASQGAENLPNPGGAGQAAGSSASSSPSAQYPDYGSLQQGTVFPNMGAPEKGGVPPTAGIAAANPAPALVANSSAANQSPTVARNPVPAGTAAVKGPVVTTQALPAKSPQVVVPAHLPVTSRSTPSLDLPLIPMQPPSSASGINVASGTSVPAAPVTASLSPEQSQQFPGASTPEAVTASDDASQTQTAEPAEGAAGASATASSDEPILALRNIDPSLRTVFKVKYVAEGVAYLDGGRSSGLAEGMKLEIVNTDLPASQGSTVDSADPRIVAELEVSGVAETSAVTDIHSPKRPIKAGDLAFLSNESAQALVQQRTLSATRKYPAVVAFTEGDPLDEEVRAEVPRPPLPSVNRARGRIGFDYLGTVSHDNTGLNSSDLGLVIRTDITRINGTFWNLSGYWRGRLSSRSAATQPTLQDLINRTYHLSMTYDNPSSAWTAGFGRLYLPWAPSLDTIDGGYFGRRLGHGATAGIFAGSTPDPTSYSYNPDQKIGGAFVNFEGGSFEATHYTSTSGLGLSFLGWQINRPFVFFENDISFKNTVSVYDSLQLDSPRGNSATPAPGPGLSRNFFTIRYQVTPRVELHFNHTYFRDVPTFDPTLVGTGLLDKYLFQGFSGGARVEVVKHVSVYSDLGLSSATGDAKHSLNQLYGITFDHLPPWGIRADVHYARFNSSFGDGSYSSLSLSRNLGDALRLEVLAGKQSFVSPFSSSNGSKFLTGNVETNLGRSFFLQGGFTTNRGSLNYDQWSFTLGYRFDNRWKKKQ